MVQPFKSENLCTSGIINWVWPPVRWVKFNVDGASKGKPGLMGVDRVVLRNEGGDFMFLFRSGRHNVEPNEVEVLVIRDSVRIFKESFAGT